eukprot:363759-Chlamydomonas_euryale.AAC.15
MEQGFLMHPARLAFPRHVPPPLLGSLANDQGIKGSRDQGIKGSHTHTHTTKWARPFPARLPLRHHMLRT